MPHPCRVVHSCTTLWGHAARRARCAALPPPLLPRRHKAAAQEIKKFQDAGAKLVADYAWIEKEKGGFGRGARACKRLPACPVKMQRPSLQAQHCHQPPSPVHGMHAERVVGVVWCDVMLPAGPGSA